MNNFRLFIIINFFLFLLSCGNLKEGFSRWYMFTQWIKGTWRGLLRLKIDGFSDHSMATYYELCNKQKDKK